MVYLYGLGQSFPHELTFGIESDYKCHIFIKDNVIYSNHLDVIAGLFLLSTHCEVYFGCNSATAFP